MSDNCPGCISRQITIEMQRRQIAALEAEVTRLKRIISNGQAAAAGIVSYSTRTMQEHQPRGTWALLRGRKEAAIEIDRCLR